MDDTTVLLNTMRSLRKDATAEEFTIEFIENKQIINEIMDLLTAKSTTFYHVPFDMIISYEIVPDRISKNDRKALVIGINYFHLSEFLDQKGYKRIVNNDDDINSVIKDRIDDLAYIIKDTHPDLFNEYTKLGIKESAYTYYKKRK